MLKTSLLIVTYFIAIHCFSQAVSNTDVSFSGKDSLLVATKDTVAAIGKPSLKIYPNPAKNKISLQVTGFETGMVKVRIMDDKGKVVREDDRLLNNGIDEINMFLQLQAGIYSISVSEKNKVVRKKLIVL